MFWLFALPAVPVLSGVLWVLLRSIEPGPGRRIALLVAVSAVAAYGLLIYWLLVAGSS